MSLLPGIPVASPIASDVFSRQLPSSAAATKQADSGSDTVSRTVQSELGRDAFLQLLVLQLRNQDPLDPQDNQQMLAQLAQFSALEQQNNLNENFDVLSGNIDQLNFISGSQLLGRHVAGIGLTGEPIEGIVDSVRLEGSVVVLTVDGQEMSMAGVLDIGIGDTPKPESTAKGRY